MEIKKKFLEHIFVSASIRRWNDQACPVEFIELDKQAHKMLIAFLLANLEEENGNYVDKERLIKYFLFNFFERIALTDIKPPIFYELQKECKKELANFACESFADELSSEFLGEMREYLSTDASDIESKILLAAHFHASKWEFDIIYNFNPRLYGVQNIKDAITASIRANEGSLKSIKELYALHYKDLVDMFAQLRFQKRWSQTPRVPATSVLGHMLIVAISSYFFSTKLGLCEKMRTNNFFAGLFHDLPEVLTRDIISPVKKSDARLGLHLREIEEKLMLENVYSKIPNLVAKNLKYYIENEFANKYIDKDGNIKCLLPKEIESFIATYNQDSFNPVCGNLVDFADKMSACMEASISIKHGITSEHLRQGISNIARLKKDFAWINGQLGDILSTIDI
ncbi:hypothetical protein BKH43_07715 [Helicobacter sp. 13S00401-1]|uniref:HD domain-containing protein n=1 Tax=Helicobacter sp. 13S00401-1 TaxID=1905758 RepID=UPI000BA69475|nr:HD domain-containing protein [Helicobacter sp. 13S00401-1]PAF48781.1 hypothetical protein BKH43_07715 [Helicobacter sp. 13S00401-1]